MDDAHRLFGAAVSEVMNELDWELLGRAYCEGDGSEFFDEALRARILDGGLVLAGALGEVLDEGGQSLYLGAEIAELPLILAERFVLGRRIVWLNVDGAPIRELTRALEVVSARLGVDLPTPSTRRLADVEPASCDHLWLVSVLTDPDHFPALHDLLYRRADGALATGRGRLEDDRARADRLVDEWLESATGSSVLTTTEEERTIIEPLVARRGWSLTFAPGGHVSAIVGDRVRIGTLHRPG